MKKYELTDETMNNGLVALHRIKALVAFADVAAGDLGGWIESERNLAQSGDAWVYGNARVSGNAWVYGNAKVSGNARVCGFALVRGNARVCGDARVYGNAWVCGDAWVGGNKHYMAIGPIGSRNDTITFTRDKQGRIYATVGCFHGPLLDFLTKVKKTHGNNIHAKTYQLAAQLAETRIDTTPIEDDKEDAE